MLDNAANAVKRDGWKKVLQVGIHQDLPEKLVQEDAKLSDKEITVLKLMCEEKSTREIALAVELSPRTVEAIRDKLKTKTGSKSTAGLIMYAMKHKLLNVDL